MEEDYRYSEYGELEATFGNTGDDQFYSTAGFVIINTLNLTAFSLSDEVWQGYQDGLFLLVDSVYDDETGTLETDLVAGYEIVAVKELTDLGSGRWQCAKVLRGVATETLNHVITSNTIRAYRLPTPTDTTNEPVIDLASADLINNNFGLEKARFQPFNSNEEGLEVTVDGPIFEEREKHPPVPVDLRAWRFTTEAEAEDYRDGIDPKPTPSPTGEFILFTWQPCLRIEEFSMLESADTVWTGIPSTDQKWTIFKSSGVGDETPVTWHNPRRFDDFIENLGEVTEYMGRAGIYDSNDTGSITLKLFAHHGSQRSAEVTLAV